MDGAGLWSSSEGKAVVVLGSLLLVVLSLLLRLRQRRFNLPPRPFPPLPVLGDVFHLRKVRSSSSFQELRQKLGPIFTLYVGHTPLIYISSGALAHEALVEKGRLLAARPQLPSRTILSNNFRSISSATYGPYWRTMRRNLVQEMLTVPRILSFAPVRRRMLKSLISSISAEAGQNDGIVMLYPNIRTAVFQLLLFMCFGYEFSPEEVSEICALVDDVFKLTFGTVLEFYPFLRFLGRTRRRRVLDTRAKQMQVLMPHIEKHKDLAKLGQLAHGSYVETLVNMDPKTELSVGDMVTLCFEFLVGGVDTTVTTIEWAMARLVADSQTQSKLFCQIFELVGDRTVDEEDLSHLPYLQAVARETLRLHPPGHYTLPHTVSGPCKIGGYDIPPNAIVQFHVVSISRDKELWDEPMKFKPERFLVNDVDITGTRQLTMMPFGAGRRICPGLGLASTHLELFIARLVQAFQWSMPPGSAVDFDEKPVFTVRMKAPLKAQVKERTSAGAL